MLNQKSKFQQKVIQAVSFIPRGRVVSYGQIALYIGLPRAARQVGWTLRELGEKENIPWWRVINQKGIISIKNNLTADRALQKKLLEAEKINVSEDFQVDIKKYRFDPSEKELRKLQLKDSYIDKAVTYHL